MVRRKTLLISRNLASGTDWTENIYLDFIPDTLVTRTIIYASDLSETGAFSIWTNIINGYIGSFFDSLSPTPTIANTIETGGARGTYRFQIHDSARQLTTVPKGDLLVYLEFIQDG